MTTQWDRSVDLVIAGSGGGGMVAGLAALDCGLEPLIVEKQALVGGSTGLSGGIVWLPNNPLMRADGIADSHDDGLAYLADVVGDIGAPSSPERREMFLTAGYEMINFLIRKGVQLVRCDGWSDYYPNHKGGNAVGRAVEGIPFDAAEAGQLERQGAAAAGQELRLRGADQRAALGAVFQPCAKGFRGGARGYSCAAPRRGYARRQILTNGASLIAQMLKSLIDLCDGEPPLWTNAAMDDLIVEDGRVVGARIVRDGTPLNVEARRGVLLAAGGFGHNADMRRRYSGDQPNEAKWSIANAGDTGEVLQTAMRLGAKTDSARRSLVVAFGFHRQRRHHRRVAGLGTTTTRRHLRRFDRPTILQRVELLRRGRQGDVRQQGGAVLDGLRRRVRAPVCHGRQPAEASGCRPS